MTGGSIVMTGRHAHGVIHGVNVMSQVTLTGVLVYKPRYFWITPGRWYITPSCCYYATIILLLFLIAVLHRL